MTRLDFQCDREELTEAAFRSLPTQLRELALFNCQELTAPDFLRFHSLVSLELHSGWFNGTLPGLFPPSLQELTLVNLPAFQGKGAFPAQLRTFRVSHCKKFTGENLSGVVQHLMSDGCPAFTPTRMARALANLPLLQTLRVTGWLRGELDPALFASHPTLRTVQSMRLSTGTGFNHWRRAATPSPEASAPAPAPEV